MSEYYKRPAAENRTEIVIDKSRFITSIARADNTEMARSFISHIREEMPDASHHVYAFCIGHGRSIIEGMSDDGEPSGTSGPPTLAVLRGSNLGDIVAVTTRYFGGIKLGTGGLVRAYTESVQTCLKSLPIEHKAPKVQLGIDIAYSYYEPLCRLLDSYAALLDDESFMEVVSLIVTVRQDQRTDVERDILDLTNGQAEIVTLATFDD